MNGTCTVCKLQALYWDYIGFCTSYRYIVAIATREIILVHIILPEASGGMQHMYTYCSVHVHVSSLIPVHPTGDTGTLHLVYNLVTRWRNRTEERQGRREGGGEVVM